MKKISYFFGVAALISLCVPIQAHAQFFKNKTITMVINYAAGGNVDIEGRIFERYLGRHIAGNPAIIVNNISGAGGLTAINQLGMGVGVKDPSTTLGFVTFNPMAVLIEDPALRVKVENFSMLAGLGAYYVTYGRKDVLTDPHRPQDITQTKMIQAAGYARASVHDVRLRLMLDLMGPRYQVITGFQSIGAVNLAMAQNEINFMLTTLPGYESQVIPNLIEKDIAVPFWQIGLRRPDGSMTGNDKVTRSGVRFFEEVYKDAYGRDPSGPKFEALQIINELMAQLARAVLMPPGAKPEASEELRRAIESLSRDETFLADYRRVIKEDPILTRGADAQALILRVGSRTTPEVKAALKAAVGSD
jgi:tripartite-type tricarboxylate transporter receptor subunit TctC